MKQIKAVSSHRTPKGLIVPTKAENLLKQMHAEILVCTACRLHKSRTHAVPGEGDLRAALMFIGEAPGETEDREGRPFRGRSGKFLDLLLARIGLTREEIFITGSVKCRPPHNRTPRDDELAVCRALWLDRQIELINPSLLVLLGKVALKQVLAKTGSLTELHGQIRERDGRPCLITYHPASAMRFPAVRAATLKDFRKIQRLLRDTATE